MSSRTSDRILAAARALLEEDGDAAPSMSAIARRAGISRQALYLHVPDRTALLLALVADVDEREDLQVGLAAMRAATDGASELRAWLEMQAWRNPRIAPLGRALDDARHEDAASAAAWRNRADQRLRGATSIVGRLRREGLVHRSWAASEATALVWELASFRVWDDLVNDAGLPPDRYVEIVHCAALAALAAPVTGGRR